MVIGVIKRDKKEKQKPLVTMKKLFYMHFHLIR